MATNRMGVIGVPRILGGENMAIGRWLGFREERREEVLVLLSRVVVLQVEYIF